jgi:hypothetical protein
MSKLNPDLPFGLGMSRIENFNCDGMCAEETCDAPYTHYTEYTEGEITFHVCFCKKHAEQLEEQALDSIR